MKLICDLGLPLGNLAQLYQRIIQFWVQRESKKQRDTQEGQRKFGEALLGWSKKIARELLKDRAYQIEKERAHELAEEFGKVFTRDFGLGLQSISRSGTKEVCKRERQKRPLGHSFGRWGNLAYPPCQSKQYPH